MEVIMSGIINIGVASRLSLMIAAAGMQFFLCHGLTAQTPNYFPHAVGDTWEYLEYDPSTGSSEVWLTTLTARELQSGGRYALWFDGNLHPTYLYDTTGFIYPYAAPNLLLMNFNAQPGDRWGVDDSPTILDSVYFGEVFGETRRIWEISHWWDNAQGMTKLSVTAYAEGLGKLFSYPIPPQPATQSILRGAIINGISYGRPLAAENPPLPPPTPRSMGQNFPNPFSLMTQIPIHFGTGDTEFTLEVCDGLGRRVRSFSVQHNGKGKQIVLWDGLDSTGRLLPDGIYHALLFGNGKVEVLVVIKSGR
jgi:hypothetical protein